LALRGILGKREDAWTWLQEKLLMRNPKEKIFSLQAGLEIQKLKLVGLINKKLDQVDLELKAQQKTLQALSPWGILDRGYALAQTLPELMLIKHITDAPPGREIRVSLAQGELDCLVKTVRQKEGKGFVQGTI
jgi:exodeoxyribonuclease VII large subunit